MKNQKGDIEILIVFILVLVMFLLIPITCHQNVKRKQIIMAKTGVEMTYWDIFWTDPELRYTQVKIVVEGE